MRMYLVDTENGNYLSTIPVLAKSEEEAQASIKLGKVTGVRDVTADVHIGIPEVRKALAGHFSTMEIDFIIRALTRTGVAECPRI